MLGGAVARLLRKPAGGGTTSPAAPPPVAFELRDVEPCLFASLDVAYPAVVAHPYLASVLTVSLEELCERAASETAASAATGGPAWCVTLHLGPDGATVAALRHRMLRLAGGRSGTGNDSAPPAQGPTITQLSSAIALGEYVGTAFQDQKQRAAELSVWLERRMAEVTDVYNPVIRKLVSCHVPSTSVPRADQSRESQRATAATMSSSVLHVPVASRLSTFLRVLGGDHGGPTPPAALPADAQAPPNAVMSGGWCHITRLFMRLSCDFVAPEHEALRVVRSVRTGRDLLFPAGGAGGGTATSTATGPLLAGGLELLHCMALTEGQTAQADELTKLLVVDDARRQAEAKARILEDADRRRQLEETRKRLDAAADRLVAEVVGRCERVDVDDALITSAFALPHPTSLAGTLDACTTLCMRNQAALLERCGVADRIRTTFFFGASEGAAAPTFPLSILVAPTTTVGTPTPKSADSPSALWQASQVLKVVLALLKLGTVCPGTPIHDATVHILPTAGAYLTQTTAGGGGAAASTLKDVSRATVAYLKVIQLSWTGWNAASYATAAQSIVDFFNVAASAASPGIFNELVTATDACGRFLGLSQHTATTTPPAQGFCLSLAMLHNAVSRRSLLVSQPSPSLTVAAGGPLRPQVVSLITSRAEQFSALVNTWWAAASPEAATLPSPPVRLDHAVAFLCLAPASATAATSVALGIRHWTDASSLPARGDALNAAFAQLADAFNGATRSGEADPTTVAKHRLMVSAQLATNLPLTAAVDIAVRDALSHA